MASLVQWRQLLPRLRWKSFPSARRLVPGVRLRGSDQVLLKDTFQRPTVSGLGCRYLHLSASLLSPSSEHHSVTVEVGESPLTFSTGKYVKLADGAILVESGETSVMVTAVSEKNVSASGFGLPLQVDYRERASATNRIPLTFFRRELRATSSEILVSRFIDRSVRPLFPPGYSYNTQVICNMLAIDRRHDPEILSINGASAALAISDIPWNGPIGAVRIGLIDNKFCVNPDRKMLNSSNLNIIVAATADKIVMVEGSANQVSEEQFCEAVDLGFKEAQPLISSLAELQQRVNKQPREVSLNLPPPEIVDIAKNICGDSVMATLLDTSHKKISRDNELFASLDELKSHALSSHPSVSERLVGDAFWGHVTKESMCSLILDNDKRCDGRGMTDLRPISCEVDVFKPLHGSSIFTRGETQVFCSVTFDSPRSAYRPNLLSLILGGPKNQSFMVHYEFPPFATNTTGMFLSMARREIGHGCLAEKALTPLMPAAYPFTVRVNAQVLESNGSSSMATVCGGSLALFDAGVPMPYPVAGVACGLFTRTKSDSDVIDQYQILTDINGIEDALGNMDFKVAGTRNGITAAQVDIKGMTGLPFHIFEEAVMRSRDARCRVLDKMDEIVSTPREGIKENGPAYAVFNVPMEKRGKLIGAGGHRIKAIAEETETVVESVDEENMSIFAPSQEAMEEAKERVDAILNEAEMKTLDIQIGSVIEVVVKDIREYGFMVELAPGVLSLLHVAQLSHDFTSHPSESGISVGDKLNVKFLGRDSNGRYLVSRKALLPLPANRAGPRGGRARPSVPVQNFEVGSELEAKIVEARDYGFMLELPSGVTTLLHNSQMSDTPLLHPSLSGFKVGDTVKVRFEGHDTQGRLLVSQKPLPTSSDNSAMSEESSHPPLQTTDAGQRFSMEEHMKRSVIQRGSVLEVTIKDIRDYGFKVEAMPGVFLLLHITQLSHDFVPHPSHTGLKLGDKVKVKVLGRDRIGRILISRKALLPHSHSRSHSHSGEPQPDQQTLTSEHVDVDSTSGDQSNSNNDSADRTG